MSVVRVPFEEMHQTVKSVFQKAGMEESRADLAARIHTESSCDGVFSHGLNRIPTFIRYVQDGMTHVNAEPELIGSTGSIEKYNGNKGPGVLNARFAMNRAMAIAEEQGLGLVTLNNTSHWMRGGTYGWQAAEKGFIGICWTNTESCMPAWGAASASVGNNPLVLAVPGGETPVVLDMAMSQFSYGKLQTTRLAGETLPLPGGYDDKGELTCDPGAIEQTGRILPAGYWKGSGLATLLDLLAAVLSGGLSTSGLDDRGYTHCTGCSQVFLAVSPEAAGGASFISQTVVDTIEHLHRAEPVAPGNRVRYPGESTLQKRKENREKGIPVDPGIWEKVKGLAASL